MQRLFTKKRLRSLALVLVLLVMLLGAGFLLIPRPTTKWAFQAQGYADSVSSPIESRGLVYSFFQRPGSNHTVYAFDAHSGQVTWSSRIDGLIDTAPLVANGLLYVLADDTFDKQSTLYALDAASGREQWSYQQTPLSSPTVVNGIVYIHSSNGTLYAFNALSGHQLWSAPVGDSIFDTPIVANHLVYMEAENAARSGSTVFALDATSGAQKWSAMEATPLIGQLAVANGLVYLAANTTDAQIWALDAFSGRTRWSVQLARPTALVSPLFVALSFQVVNGLAFVDDARADARGLLGPNTLYALDALTGQLVWTAPTVSAVPTIANGKVYLYSGNVFSRNGGLICPYATCPTASADVGNGALSVLDARSGRQQWSHPAVPFEEPSLSSAPEPAVASGTVYVWTTEHNKDRLYALNAVSGSEQWSYQTGGSFSTSPTVVQGMVYTCLWDGFNEKVQAIQSPGGPPGFTW